MKALRYILVGFVAAAVIALLCYQGFVTHELTTSNLTRAVLILAGLVLALFRKPRRRASRNDYRAAYGSLIGNAFSDDPKLEAKFFKALEDYNRDRHAEALKKLDQLRQDSPRSADRFAVSVFTALCYDDLNLHQEAIRHYTAALQIREHSTVASNLGLCHAGMGNHAAALECYERAIRADGSNPNPYNNIAQLHIRQGEYDKALPYAEKAADLNGNFPQALNALTICHEMLGNQEEADAFFRRTVACGSNGKDLRAYIDNLKS